MVSLENYSYCTVSHSTSWVLPVYSVLVYSVNTVLGLLDYGKSHYGVQIRTFDSFLPPILQFSKFWVIIILANAQNMHLQVGSRSWLTSWLSSVQSVSWSASVLQETGKAVGYDRYTLAGSGLHIGCRSRTPSRKIPRQAKAIVRSLLPSWGFGGIGFSQFPSATIFFGDNIAPWAVLHRVFIVVCVVTPPYKTMGSCHFLIVAEVSQHLR